jgi:hypothetical protein
MEENISRYTFLVMRGRVKKEKETFMNSFSGFIQAFLYYPSVSLFLYLYLILFVPGGGSINITEIFNFLSRFMLRKKK